MNINEFLKKHNQTVNETKTERPSLSQDDLQELFEDAIDAADKAVESARKQAFLDNVKMLASKKKLGGLKINNSKLASFLGDRDQLNSDAAFQGIEYMSDYYPILCETFAEAIGADLDSDSESDSEEGDY